MGLVLSLGFLIGLAFFISYLYQIFYIFVPFIKDEPPTPAGRRNRMAVMISARNEAGVIKHLLESIKAQTYPQELIEIFVVADNCTDNTAEIAEGEGVHVYKRFDDINIGKGYAMHYLMDQIKAEFGENYFDGYFVFDADNVLDSHYIEEMNNTFSCGYEILTSYRNSKNYGDNWISAGYALWFLRESKYLNYPRMLLGTSCAISGTGFMFSKRVAKELDGWDYYLLTEDIQFTVDHVINDYKIGFCKRAMLFDEQPNTFRQSVRQRMRWARGYFQVMCHYGLDLAKTTIEKKSWSCFDMSMNIMPAIILTLLTTVINGAAFITGLIVGEDIIPVLMGIAMGLLSMYILFFGIGLLTTVTEWRNIYTTTWKKIKYTFTFPLFMMTYMPITFMSLFKHVEWKPIVHSESKSLADIKECG